MTPQENKLSGKDRPPGTSFSDNPQIRQLLNDQLSKDPDPLSKVVLKSGFSPQKIGTTDNVEDDDLPHYVRVKDTQYQTNFHIYCVDYYKLNNPGAPPKYMLLLFLIRKIPDTNQPNGYLLRRSLVWVDLSMISQNKYIDNLIPVEFSFSPTPTPSNKRIIIRSLINQYIVHSIPQDITIPDCGFDIIDGTPCYTLGNKVYCNDKSIVFLNKNTSQLLPLRKNGNWLLWLKKFVYAKNIEPVLFLCAILPYMFHLIHRNDDDRRFAVYCKGPSSVGKTTRVELVTNIFVDQSNCMSLSSGKKDLRKLCGLKGCPLVFEDYNKSKSSDINSSNKRKLSDVIGQFQSFGIRSINDEDAAINGILFVTAEKYIKNASTLNRCLILEFLEKFDPDQMTWLQDNKDLFMCFIDEFITYLIENDTALRQSIEGYKVLCKSDGSEYEGYNIDFKILKTRETLMVTLMVLEDFICNKYHIMPKDFDSNKDFSNLIGKFKESIENCICKTLELVGKQAPKPGTEYIDIITKMLFSDGYKYSVTNSFKLYQEYRAFSKKKAAITGSLTFIGYYDKSEDCVCIKSQDLLKYFNQLEGLKFKPTVKGMIKQLKAHGMLKIAGDNESTYPITGLSRTRYLHLRASDFFLWFKGLNSANSDYCDFVLKDGFDSTIIDENEFEFCSFPFRELDDDDDPYDDIELVDEEVNNREIAETKESEYEESEYESSLDNSCQGMCKDSKKHKNGKKGKKDPKDLFKP